MASEEKSIFLINRKMDSSRKQLKFTCKIGENYRGYNFKTDPLPS